MPTENESEKLTEDSWWLLVNRVDWLTTKADLRIYHIYAFLIKCSLLPSGHTNAQLTLTSNKPKKLNTIFIWFKKLTVPAHSSGLRPVLTNIIYMKYPTVTGDNPIHKHIFNSRS